ncbi:unnamed protein product, partial [Linum tenue]
MSSRSCSSPLIPHKANKTLSIIDRGVSITKAGKYLG